MATTLLTVTMQLVATCYSIDMSYTSQQVLKYIKKIHKKGFSLDHTVQNHAEWELKNIPVADLKIASEDDPYNRVLDLNQDHVDTITKQDILARAIVADENGHIIDGNHRAAKAEALGMSVVPAFVPVVDPDNETYDQHMKRIKTNETTEPSEYVYHASFLPDPQQGLKSVLLQGLRPSETGYAGPGVYFAYKPEDCYYHVSEEEATMFRVKWADLVGKFGKYPENPKGIERDDNEIIVPGSVPANMLEVEYFPGEWWDLKSAYEASKGPVNEAVIDNVNGAGAVPYNQDVDYFGLRVKMKPSTFLKLAAPLGREHSAELEQYIADGGSIGAPFLDVAIPPEWDENDFSKSAQIKGHEGRNRMTAILKLEGDKPVETHIFPKYYRARDMTPAFIEKLNSGLYAEKSTHLIGGPLFTTGVSESITEAFDQPYKLRWEKGDYGDVDAYTKLDDGNYLSIMFNKGYNADKEEAWSVEFFRNNSQEVTGEGDAQRVFATVLSAIQTFIKKYKPNRVIFSASKEVEPGQNTQSRARLYDSLVQRYARTWGFKSFRADAGDKVIYELSRIKPLAEGGWASTATQNTVITPQVIEEAIGILNQFAEEFNAWQAEQGLDVEIRMGKPVGSGTYYQRDLKQDPTREYGDVDVTCYIHSREGVGAAKRTTEYANAVKQFTEANPKYSTANGANVIMDTSAGPIQVDLIFTYNEHANWARALAPEYRVKGVISASLLSSLAEVLNMSFGLQGVQVKTRAGRPVSFRQSKDTELHTVSTDPEMWASDMFSYYYQLANGHKPESIPANLTQHSGLKDEQRLSDIVMAFKALATDLEASGLLGTGALDYIADKTDMMKKIAQVYSNKLEAVINSSKFDKAETPAAVEKASKTKLMLAKYRNEIARLLLNQNHLIIN